MINPFYRWKNCVANRWNNHSTQAAHEWENQDLKPIGLSQTHRSLCDDCDPRGGANILLWCLGTTQVHFQEDTVQSPSMWSEKNTAFCPVTAHGSSPLFEGKMKLWDPSQTYGQTSFICMVLRLDPPNIPSRIHLHFFQFLPFFLPVAYLYVGGGWAYAQANKGVGHPALPLLTLFPADRVSHWAWS